MNSITISGISITTSLGLDTETNWVNLLNKKSVISKIEGIDLNELPIKNGYEIKYLIDKKERWKELFSIMMENLIVDSALSRREIPKTILSLGLSFPGIEGNNSFTSVKKIETFLKEKYNFKKIIINTNTCTASNFAISIGANIIKRGSADRVICGGFDLLSKYVFAGFNSLHTLTNSIPLPFSKNREGLSIGEGGALLLLENNNSIKKRDGQKKYCRYMDFASTSDTSGVTGIDKKSIGLEECFRIILNNNNLKTDDIDLIVPHATATKQNDYIEATSIKNIFGNSPLITALKPYFGHILGGSSAIQLALIAKMFETSTIIGMKDSDNLEFDLNFIKNNRDKTLKYVLNSALGFGGINSTLLLGAC